MRRPHLGLSLFLLIACSDGGSEGVDAAEGDVAGGQDAAATDAMVDGTGGPVARFELEARDLTVSVDDAGSNGGAGALVAFEWSFGDGAVATGQTPPPHRYGAAGTYTVKLLVRSGTGDTASSSQSVTVAARAPGSYAPDDATTGVPDIVKDRLLTVDLEMPDKSGTNTPTTAAETLFITKNGADYLLRRNNSSTLTLPGEHVYLEDGRLILDRLHVRGYIDVRAADVTLRRTIIEGLAIPDAPASAAPAGVDTGRRLLRGNNAAAIDLVVEDVELRVPAAIRRGSGINPSFHHGLGVEASRLTMLRSEITGTVDGMQVWQGGGSYTDVLVERSWIHDIQFHVIDAERSDGDSSHSDGIQVECSLPRAGQVAGVRILGNTIDMTSDPNLNASVMITRNACATAGLLIQHNFMDGTVLPVNCGTGTATLAIVFYANDNRFGPNRATGTKPDKTWTSSFTAKVMAVKSNTDSSAAFENFDASKTQNYVYFSFDPPVTVGGVPPTGEASSNIMVDHDRNGATWGSTSRGIGGIGLY